MGSSSLSSSTFHIFVSAGELSGDMHAAALIRALRDSGYFPFFKLSAVGSRNLESQGAHIIFDSVKLSSIGVLANLPKIPIYLSLFRRVVKYILTQKVDVVILVDYRFFNLNLARILREEGFRGAIIYYITPTLWQAAFDDRYQEPGKAPAGFIRKMSTRFNILRDCCDLSIAIYPIGLELLEYFGVKHIYIGHPICQLAKPTRDRDIFLNSIQASSKRLVGLMPGSRTSEVKLIGRELVRAAEILSKGLKNLAFAIPVATDGLIPLIKDLTSGAKCDIKLLPFEERFNLIAYSELMLVASGTAVHECAVIGTPHIICYKLPWLHDFIYSTFSRFRLPYYGFTNIMARREIVPELIRSNCAGSRIASVAEEYLASPSRASAVRAELARLKGRFCKPEVFELATSAIAKVLSEKKIIG